MIRLPKEFKTGDTFKLPFTVTDPSTGEATTITGWSFRSHLRTYDDVLIQNLTFTVDSEPDGEVTISATPVETRSWPLGHHVMDIEVTDASGDVFSTVDIQVSVIRGRTYD